MEQLLNSHILLFVFFLILSAFFSGSETALFSINKSELYNLALSKRHDDNLIASLVSQPYRILISILIGNLIVNILLTTIMTDILLGVFGEYGHFIAIAIVTPIIIIICEIIPKIISISASIAMARRIVRPLYFFHHIFFPVRIIFITITNVLIKVLKVQNVHDTNLTQKEIDIAIRLNESHGYLEQHESEFIKNVLRLPQKTAENVMVPRNEADSIAYNASVQDAIELFRKSGHLRVPVYKGDMDNIIGLIDSRDFIPYLYGVKKAKHIKHLIKEIEHYPESKELAELLADFLQKKIQIAVLVDEYGGTSGIVTLSAIISEVMGDDFSLDDIDQKPDVRKVKDTVIIKGDMQLVDFNDTFEEHLKSNENETIGGYFIETVGNIPVKGTWIEIEHHRLKVRNIRKNKIESLELLKR